jgi:hypothetical protein
VGFFVAQQYLYTMKIRLTESQINRVLLNEEGESTLYKDENFDMKILGFNKNEGKIVLKPGEDGEIKIELRNFANKPIIFNIVKVSSLITNLKTTNTGKQSEIIRQFLDYTFTVPKTKTGTFTAGFTFVYQIVGSSTQITKSINIPFYREGQDERMYTCKSHVNEDLLKEAIDWWKTWLNNQSTKNRFAKSFKYDTSTVEKHFAEYNKILSQIKMEYVFSDKRNRAWVMPNFLTNGYNLPITINCSMSIDAGRDDLNKLLIHEIQHILDDYHKFHPYSDMDLDTTSGNPKVNTDVLKKNLRSVGFNDTTVQSIIMSYFLRLKNSINHLKHPNEIMSTLSEVRSILKLTPNQKITKEMIIGNYRNGDIMLFICQWLYSEKTLDNFLNFSNSIAMGKPNTTNTNLA